jgi:CheY-like chemotaxis protein
MFTGARSGENGPMRKVLIVEDDEELRHALQASLEDEGYRVECAADGEEALDLLLANPDPYLILLDLLMPRMNGWEFRARQLSDPRLSHYPVVIMSATENLEEAAISGADVLHKPIALPQLIATVARHLAADDFADDPKTQPRGPAPFETENVPIELAPDDTLPN